MTNAVGHTQSYKYDRNGNVIEFKDGRGNIKRAIYDVLNRRIATIDECSNETKFTYDKLGRVIEILNAENAKTCFEYNKIGKITKVTDSLENTTIFSYDELNRATQIINSNGEKTQYIYNSLDLVEKIIDPLGYVNMYEYNENGNLVKQTNSSYESYRYEYNSLGQVIKTIDPLGYTNIFVYDAVGRICQVEDKNRNITTYVYDGNGNVIETIDAYGNSFYFEYSAINQLTKMRLQRKEGDDNFVEEQMTLYQYDSRGFVTRVINSQGNEKMFVYDENGNVIQQTDEDGYVTKYDYNEKNLITLINYSNEKNVFFQYNKVGKLISMEDWLGKTTFELDAINQVTSVIDHNNKKIGYNYDTLGRRTEMLYPDKSKVNYKYDALSRLTSVMTDDGQVIRYEYGDDWNPVKVIYPNDIVECYNYDQLGRIVEVVKTDSQGQNAIIMNQYDYDPHGNMINQFKYDMFEGEHQRISYNYDKLNRLITVKENQGLFNRAYQYDSLSNLIAESDGNNTVQYNIDNMNRLVFKNVNNKEIYNYVYDKRGNMIKAQTSDNKHVASYVYDVTNRMIKGTNQTGENSIYIFNGLGACTGHIGNVCKEFVVDYKSYKLREIAETQGNHLKFKYIYDDWNRVSTEVLSGFETSKMYNHNDYLGSSICLSDKLGEIQAMADYDEWGKRTKINLFNFADNALDLASNYTGHSWDNELGLYFAQARMYDNKNKRFMAEDLYKGNIYTANSLNAYTYCANNPLIYVDPDGKRLTNREKNAMSTAFINGIFNETHVFLIALIRSVVSINANNDGNDVIVFSEHKPNWYSAFHDTAQIISSRYVNELNDVCRVILEYHTGGGEHADIVGINDILEQGYIWEVKALGNSPARQLRNYTRATNFSVGSDLDFNQDGYVLLTFPSRRNSANSYSLTMFIENDPYHQGGITYRFETENQHRELEGVRGILLSRHRDWLHEELPQDVYDEGLLSGPLPGLPVYVLSPYLGVGLVPIDEFLRIAPGQTETNNFDFWTAADLAINLLYTIIYTAGYIKPGRPVIPAPVR